MPVAWCDDLSDVLAHAVWIDFVGNTDAQKLGNVVSWSGDIKAGASVEVSYQVKVKAGIPAGTKLVNAVTSEDAPDKPEVTIPVTEDGEVGLAKRADKQSVKPGDTITYEVLLTNNTNADKSGVAWSDDLSDVLAHADWTGFVGDTDAQKLGNVVSWSGDIKIGRAV